jgi:xylulokinase
LFLGIDIGTSSVKAVLVDEFATPVAQASMPLLLARPQPLWAEQDPGDWWRAVVAAVRALPAAPRAAVRAIGLCGQMHGATLLDAFGNVLRPAILWSDGRAGAECVELERREPRSRAICGNIMMPGFTAPKLLWVSRHEPQVFARTARVLLPKDYVRLQLTGAAVSDMSDASGTGWLDVARRDWSDAMLAATGLDRTHMPQLVEGSAASGS